MKVKDAMHRGVEWVTPETPLADLAKRMRDHDIGALPVGDDDKLVGMVTDRDIVCRGLTNGKDPAKLTARDIMTPAIVWCRSEEDLDDATRIMESKRIRRLPVIDENKRMVGILSLGDISHARKSGELSGEVLHAVSAHHS
ncbi:MAG: CBS domain-containing protein [Hyphomicrobiaceae bacterium]